MIIFSMRVAIRPEWNISTSLNNKLNQIGRIIGEWYAQTDGAGSVQHNLFLHELNQLAIAEADISAIGTEINDGELVEIEIDTGMLA